MNRHTSCPLEKVTQIRSISRKIYTWQHPILVILIVGPAVWLLSLDPIPQDPQYHLFADTRQFLGVPNFFDVISNLPFFAVGLLGLQCCRRRDTGISRSAWIILFAGVGLVGMGSAYYHWNPTNKTLVWDRLPMTIGFMGLFVALLGEYVDNRLVRLLLLPALAVGVASVFYWHWRDDLRLYIWVQLVPLLAVPVLMILF